MLRDKILNLIENTDENTKQRLDHFLECINSEDSNVDKVLILIPFVRIQAFSISTTELVICFISSDSNAIIRIFSSLTKKGLYFIFLLLEGNTNS